MNKLYEELKVDLALSTTLSNTDIGTGRYYKLGEYRRAMFNVVISCANGIPDGESVLVRVMEAKTAAGGDAQALIDLDAGADPIIEVVGLVDSVVVVTDTTAGTGIENNDYIVVNGVTFTKAAATDNDENEFIDAAALAAQITNAGIGLTAVDNAGVVTISATEAGSKTVTLVESAAQASGWTPGGYTTIAAAAAEVYVKDLAEDFAYVALRVENDATEDIDVGAMIVRANAYVNPVQQTLAAFGVPE